MTLLLAAAILLSVPLFVALLRQNPRYRLWAFTAVAALPFCPDLPVEGYFYGWSEWRGTSLGIAVSLSDALALALIITRRRTPGKLPFWILFAFYGFALFTSVFFSALWLGTVFVWWQFGRVLLLFAAVAGESHRIDVRNSLATGFALGLIYQAAYVIPQKLSGVIQAHGTIVHQNIFGLMIELSVLPLIGIVLAGNRSKLVMAGIAAALICIAGTGSRATMVFGGGAVLVLLLVSLVRRSTPLKVRAVVLAVAGLAIMTPFALATLNNRFQGGSYVTTESTRTSFEESARSMAADHPFGVGANQFVLISNRDGYATRAGVPWGVNDRSKPVHNAYLLARAETGWIGEISFILMLCVPLVAGLRLAFTDRMFAAGEVALSSAIALAANVIHNNWEFAVHTSSVQAILFINLGMIAALLREKRMTGRQAHKSIAREAGAARDRANPAREAFLRPE